jgi:SAM-dependent methyltransferase
MNTADNVTLYDRQGNAASPNRALWEKGDFTRIAASMRASGEEFVQLAGIERGMKVLDLGCGDGTTAIPAAQLGADVLGVDIASNLVAAASQRAMQFGLADHCRFNQGDACDLSGIENKTFHRVISVFGAMFAPKPFDVAREMVRVTRPGGKIVMGNWIPNDPTLVAQILKISAAYSPPPPEGFVSPMLWGVESHIHDRFAKAGIPTDAITCERDTYLFDFDGSPEQFVDTFRQFYGPTMNAFDAAAKEGRTQALRDELVKLFESQNLHQYPNQTLIQAAYLRVSVQVG